MRKHKLQEVELKRGFDEFTSILSIIRCSGSQSGEEEDESSLIKLHHFQASQTLGHYYYCDLALSIGNVMSRASI